MIIFIIPLLIAMEWIIPPFINEQWELTMLLHYMTIGVLMTFILHLINRQNLIIKSCFALFAVDAWCDVGKFGLYHFSDYEMDLSLIGFIIFVYWFVFILKRKYPEQIDLVNSNNVNILIKKPKTSFDVAKGLIGLSAASICICAEESVWCFRRKSGMFEKTMYHKQWSESHLVIDTRVKFTNEHKIMLDNLIGTMRHPCIKCVYTIRFILNALGEKYTIKSWFDYIPGIYFMKVAS